MYYYAFKLIVILLYTVPSPNVTITADTMDTFIRGTERSITCDIALNPPLPMNTSVVLEWRKDGVIFDNSTDRVIEGSVVVTGNTYSSTISFFPLNTTDNGTYECIATVDTAVLSIISSTNSESLPVIVNGK